MANPPSSKIDRQTTCPFHLKLFYRTGGFHSLSDFPLPPTPNLPLPPHLQIYTWQTCTLRELSHLLVSALPALLPAPAIGTRLAYRLIFPDTRPPPSHLPPGAHVPRYIAKDIGYVVVGAGAGEGVMPTEEEREMLGGEEGGVMGGALGGEPERTLGECRFVVGDWVDVAILEGGRDAGVTAGRRGEFAGGARGGGGRENGYAGGGYGGRGRGGAGGGRGGYGGGGGRLGGEAVPSGEWRRGESLPDGRGYGWYGRGRGRGRGY